MSDDRSIARKLARESLADGDPLGWFETLYAQAEGNPSVKNVGIGTIGTIRTKWLGSARC